MRLLRREKSRWFAHRYTFSLTKWNSGNTPAYAILSHRWGADEVTLADIENGTARTKNGYRKLEFCAEQAAHDGLMYFWIDTCCIDKSSSAELSEAINSMFKWYQKATRCYVHLSDVPAGRWWESAFQGSQWFQRGRTLQELIAPTTVEFFSLDGARLGDKKTLERQISHVTGISIEVLRGKPLCQIDQGERFSWTAKRQTTIEEDAVYCLLGIFDIHMSLIYGEGHQKALARLRREIRIATDPDLFVTKDVAQVVPSRKMPLEIESTDLIISIDVGMSHTVVCYTEAPGWYNPRSISTWPRPPHNDPGKIDDCVPTEVAYDVHGNFAAWGFLARHSGQPVTLERQFKLYMGPFFIDSSPRKPSHAEATKFYSDFMRSLYRHIEHYFNITTGDFHNRNIEFLLSVPTSWRNPSMIASLEQTLANSGFKGNNRRLAISRTEAEAIVLNTGMEAYGTGDVIVVVNADESITSVNILQITGLSERSTAFKTCTEADSLHIGSFYIDFVIRNLIITHLRAFGAENEDMDLKWIVTDMLEAEQFESIKRGFTGDVYQLDILHIFAAPSNWGLFAEDKYIEVSGQQLKAAFDSLIQKITTAINLVIAEFTKQNPQTSIHQVLLSGDLWSSPYAVKELKNRFAPRKTICTPEPRLAVAKGLIKDRIQKLKADTTNHAERQRW